MNSSTRKWVVTGVEIAFVGLGVWAAPAAVEYFRAQTALRNVAARSRPTEAVQQLLDATGAPGPTLDGSFPCVSSSVEGEHLQPTMGKCPVSAEYGRPVDEFEVDLRYGDLIVRQTDLYLHDVFDVPLTRSYNSGDYLHPNRVHAFGKNTNHPYDRTIVGTRYPYTHLFLILEDGEYLFFPRVSRGQGFADAVYKHTESATNYYGAVIAWNGDGWTLFRQDGLTILFPESYSSTNEAQGAAYAMRDAAGDVLKLIRDGKRDLREIRTPRSRWIKLEYDNLSRIIRATDDQGRSAAYAYNQNGMLDTVSFKSGAKRHYMYNGDLMTLIFDEKHHILLQNTYKERRIIRQEFGLGNIYSYEYHISNPRNSYADGVTVTLPDGTRTTLEVGDFVPEERKHDPH